MPLLVALGGVIPTLAVLVGATLLGDVSIFSVNVVNMLGIGLGIDYGLLMVNRFREERGHGLDVHDAVVATVATAGTTVVFSALTVAVAMSGLFVFGVPMLTSFGIAGLAVVLLCMVAAVTLLPGDAGRGRRAHQADALRRPTSMAASTDSPAGCRPARRGRRRRRAGAACCWAFRSSAPDSRTATPARCHARRRCGRPRWRWPNGSRPAAPIPSPSIADVDATDPAFAGWLADVSSSPGVVGASIRPGTPPGLTVVDLVPAGTIQGAPATALVERIRNDPPPFDDSGRRTGRRAHRREGQSSVLGCPSRPPWSAWRPSSCCS